MSCDDKMLTLGEQFGDFSQVILELVTNFMCHVGSHVRLRHVDAFQCQLSAGCTY